MAYGVSLKGKSNGAGMNIKDNIIDKLKFIKNGSLTIINQDGHSVQFNINETYLNGDYLC